MRRNSLLAVLGILALVLIGFLYVRAQFGSINMPFNSEPPETRAGEGVQGFGLPDGFVMRVFARGVQNARVMALDPAGALLVSQPREGRVVALTDTNGDGASDKNDVVISGLRGPHGLVFDCRKDPCDLYIAEEDSVAVYTYNAETKKAEGGRDVVELPKGSGHSTRSLLFLASPEEDTLLISVGSSCNVCKESDQHRAAVLAYDTRTEKTTTFATGLRNSVFMTLHPVSGKVWASEMGRDNLGDDIPPEEVNIVERGKNYGWPFCYGKNIHDDEFDPANDVSCGKMAPSTIDMQAHSAPLGIAFIPEEGWPEEWWYDAIVAFHGSWNRSVPTGYKIVRIPLDAQGRSEGPIQDFVTGFMRPDGKTVGRPVGVMVFSGGRMFISDDQAGIIYEVRRN